MVARLIYISDIPRPAGFPGEDLGWIDTDPHLLVHPDGRFVLDNDLWLGSALPLAGTRRARDRGWRWVRHL